MTDDQTVSLARIESCVSEIDAWIVQNKQKLSRRKTDLLILSAQQRPAPVIKNIDASGEKVEPTPAAGNIVVLFHKHFIF